jgi:hypothetical protein
MFDWSKVTDKVAIHCKTEKEVETFLAECDKQGIKWCSGEEEKCSKSFRFSDYRESACFNLMNDEVMAYADMPFYTGIGYTILEFSDLYTPDLPRICYILGGEDNPLEIGETFEFDGASYHVGATIDGEYLVWNKNGYCFTSSTLGMMLNHPEKIIRQPRFSEDEKALMRLCAENGYYQWYRDESNQLHVKEYSEMYGPEINCIEMKGITKQFTHENPFDFAKYLNGGSENA